jgi:hypothetical protein
LIGATHLVPHPLEETGLVVKNRECLGRLAVSIKQERHIPLLPAHVREVDECCVNADGSTTLGDAADIRGQDAGEERHCGGRGV